MSLNDAAGRRNGTRFIRRFARTRSEYSYFLFVLRSNSICSRVRRACIQLMFVPFWITRSILSSTPRRVRSIYGMLIFFNRTLTGAVILGVPSSDDVEVNQHCRQDRYLEYIAPESYSSGLGGLRLANRCQLLGHTCHRIFPLMISI